MRAITVRLPNGLLDWLRKTSRLTGKPMARLAREHLARAQSEDRERRLMRFAGVIKGGPSDLSSRKAFLGKRDVRTKPYQRTSRAEAGKLKGKS